MFEDVNAARLERRRQDSRNKWEGMGERWSKTKSSSRKSDKVMNL
jgi:hypothetical protein